MRSIAIFVVVIFICLDSSFAQDCNKEFIKSITVTFLKCEKKFERKALKLKQNYKVSIPQFIYLPTVFSRKLNFSERLNPGKLLCYLNTNKLEFEDAIVFNKDSMIGTIGLCPGDNCVLRFMENEHSFSLFYASLFSKISEIHPSFIFTVYNLPGVYWFVKDDELYALTYEYKNKKMSDFKTFKAERYIQSFINEDQLVFLSPNRVKVVSGK